MPEAEFWKLIDVLGGSTDDDAVERLTGALRAGGKEQAVAFQERLAAALFELDREVLFRQGVRFVGDPPDAPLIPLSSDSFLYLRAGIVAKGRRVVERVLADPAVLTSSQWEECEVLLYAAEEAIGEEIETAISYETGENGQHWPTAAVDPGEHRRPVEVWLVDHVTQAAGYGSAGSTEPSGRTGPTGSDEFAVFSWPVWFSNDVFLSTTEFAHAVVEDGGGIPGSMGVSQLRVFVELGYVWQLTPRVDRHEAMGPAEEPAVEIRIAMRQEDFRSWAEAEQVTALRAVVATCLLAVLPADHAGLDALRDAVSAGAALLPVD